MSRPSRGTTLCFANSTRALRPCHSSPQEHHLTRQSANRPRVPIIPCAPHGILHGPPFPAQPSRSKFRNANSTVRPKVAITKREMCTQQATSHGTRPNYLIQSVGLPQQRVCTPVHDVNLFRITVKFTVNFTKVERRNIQANNTERARPQE